MFDHDERQEGARARLEGLISRFGRLGGQPYSTIPGFAYLLELERAVQAEVDRMVIEMRESGYAFTHISQCATFGWREHDSRTGGRLDTSSAPAPFHPEGAEPWQRWHARYRDAVKRVRGDDEEVLPLHELQRRRREIEKLETQLRVGPRPVVQRSADNQREASIRAEDLQRGDCIGGFPSRIVVRAEAGDAPDGRRYIAVVYHDGMEYPYSPDHEFDFGRERNLWY